MADDTVYATPSELAERYQISRWTVVRRADEWGCVTRIGRSVRIDVEAFERKLKEASSKLEKAK